MEVTLYTVDGHAVTTVHIPRFAFAPEILVWGTRHFMRDIHGTYREASVFFVMSPPPAPGPMRLQR